MKSIRFALFCILIAFVSVSAEARVQLAKILVCPPVSESRDITPFARAMATSLMREFSRSGGVEVSRYSGRGEITTRNEALEVARKNSADVVIYGSIKRHHDVFLYTLVFLDVNRNLVQRTIDGRIQINSTMEDLSRIMSEQVKLLAQYVPTPAELEDPGVAIRDTAIDYQRLPRSASVGTMPFPDRFGHIEQVLTFWRIRPGEEAYYNFMEEGKKVHFIEARDLDAELQQTLKMYHIYGMFAIRNGLQAYVINNCSRTVLNVLIANGIPVFYGDGVLVEYSNLDLDGFSVFKGLDGMEVFSEDITMRSRQAVMFMVPKPGQRGGISRSYLEKAIEFYPDELGRTPRLLDVGGNLFNIIKQQR